MKIHPGESHQSTSKYASSSNPPFFLQTNSVLQWSRFWLKWINKYLQWLDEKKKFNDTQTVIIKKPNDKKNRKFILSRPWAMTSHDFHAVLRVFSEPHGRGGNILGVVILHSSLCLHTLRDGRTDAVVPVDFKSRDSWLVAQNVSLHLIELWLRWRVFTQLRVCVLVVDEVPHSNKLLSSVGTC